jgi:hypothetical protein
MRTLAIACCILVAGCLSRHETVIVPPIHITVDAVLPKRATGENPIVAAMAKSIFGPETAVAQAAIGCGRFYEQNGRWPRTKDEVAAGLISANLSPVKLNHLAELRLREDGGTLTIDFVSTENGRVQGTITLLSPKMPIQAPASVVAHP